MSKSVRPPNPPKTGVTRLLPPPNPPALKPRMTVGENGSIAAMREKPELDFLTNTGVYVVEPRVVEEMRDGEKIGFPDVIERYRRAGEKVGVYPISESSWMDMGQLEELEKMRRKLENQQ